MLISNEHATTQEIIDHSGRSDFVGSYHSGRYVNHENKHAQREKVLDYILTFNRDKPASVIRLLSLPGKDWTFENMLYLEHQRTQFIGLEHSFSVYSQAKRSIPVSTNGRALRYNHVQDREIPFGRGSVVYSRIASNCLNKKSTGRRSSRSNRLLLMDSETYMTMMYVDYGAYLDQKKEFFEKFYWRNTVWLDFTSPLCSSVESTIRHLPICLSNGKIPVVITLMNARDKYHGIDERVNRIQQIQPLLKVNDTYTYLGKGNVSMLTLFCSIFMQSADFETI